MFLKPLYAQKNSLKSKEELATLSGNIVPNVHLITFKYTQWHGLGNSVFAWLLHTPCWLIWDLASLRREHCLTPRRGNHCPCSWRRFHGVGDERSSKCQNCSNPTTRHWLNSSLFGQTWRELRKTGRTQRAKDHFSAHLSNTLFITDQWIAWCKFKSPIWTSNRMRCKYVFVEYCSLVVNADRLVKLTRPRHRLQHSAIINHLKPRFWSPMRSMNSPSTRQWKPCPIPVADPLATHFVDQISAWLRLEILFWTPIIAKFSSLMFCKLRWLQIYNFKVTILEPESFC